MVKNVDLDWPADAHATDGGGRIIGLTWSEHNNALRNCSPPLCADAPCFCFCCCELVGFEVYAFLEITLFTAQDCYGIWKVSRPTVVPPLLVQCLNLKASAASGASQIFLLLLYG
jgi:hypothetical protein